MAVSSAPRASNAGPARLPYLPPPAPPGAGATAAGAHGPRRAADGAGPSSTSEPGYAVRFSIQLATHMRDQGDHRAARRELQRALRFPDLRLEERARLHHGLGNVLQHAGHYRAARKELDRALTVRQELGQPVDIAYSSFQCFICLDKWRTAVMAPRPGLWAKLMGALDACTGRDGPARDEDLYREALDRALADLGRGITSLAAAKTGAELRSKYDLQHNEAYCLEKLGLSARAIQLYELILPQRLAIGDRRGAAYTHERLARCGVSGALAHAEAALKLYTELKQVERRRAMEAFLEHARLCGGHG